MRKYVPASEVNENITWQDIAPGGEVPEGGTSDLFNTGDWRTMVPTFIEEKCKQCLLCFPVCPDSSIPVVDGVCYKVCPFGAITFGKEEK